LPTLAFKKTQKIKQTRSQKKVSVTIKIPI
jgi:hypothetical protein